MFKTRLISSICLIIALGFLIIVGGIPFTALVGILSILGMIELYRILDFAKTPLAVLCYILAGIYVAMVYTSGFSLLVVYLIAVMISILALYVFSYPRYDAKQVMCAVFGLLYVPFLLSFTLIIRLYEAGAYLIWLVFIGACISDMMAYCTGMLLGKHKMAPNLSPKKSVEGAIGGTFFATVLGVVFAIIFKDKISSVFANPVLDVAIMTFICSLASIVGDLAASAIKRNFGIKDYGNLIPGHGGILDRFDSILVVSPLVFLCIMIFNVLGI